ncbi:unnamed protein product [Allacma fusca]|uniref:Cathepsin O n=1 Tax=Allacma fusca TaxID=39272 RepID=A0A8J2L4S9_9HEXA|nr:unnamed protein product [Allacma fusca]
MGVASQKCECKLDFSSFFLHFPLCQNEGVLEQAFQNFTKSFNRTYQSKEYDERYKHFKRSMKHIEALNSEENLLMSSGAGSGVELADNLGSSTSRRKSHKQWHEGMPKNQGTARWGLTKFADISPEDFQAKFLDPEMIKRVQRRQEKRGQHKHHGQSGYRGSHEDDPEENVISRKKRAVYAGIPAKVDWRTKGIITNVKHQMSCGACWAFSTVETVESMHALQKGVTPKILSVQQVIDCATNGNMGCNGGDTCAALAWMKNIKLVTEAEYPTTLQDGTCRNTKFTDGIQIVGNYTCESFVGSEEKILKILANHGPVVVAVDATNWQFYVGGIIQWNCDANVNHAVQIVGYDTSATPPHYIARNSWGTDFGDNGYLYVAIGKNLCGVAREVSSLTVN